MTESPFDGLTAAQRQQIRTAFADARKGTSRRRHPAEVTSDRLADAVERWTDQFEPEERDMISVIRHRLEQIAELDAKKENPR